MLCAASPGVQTFFRILLVPFCFSCSLTLAADDLRYLLFEPTVLSGELDPLNAQAPKYEPQIAAPNAALGQFAANPSAVADQTDFSQIPDFNTALGIAAQPEQKVNAAISIEEFIKLQGKPPADELGLIERDIAEYKKLIADLEHEGGAYEARLSEELLSLAALHQKTGDYAEAQTLLNRAAHIARINNGLFDESQVPLIKRVIENYVELGDIVAADRQQSALFYMQKKIHGHSGLDLLPALQYFADWNLFAATTNITPPPPAEDSAADGKQVVDLAAFQFERLLTAQNLYEGIRQVMIRNTDYHDLNLAEVEEQQLIILHLFASRYGPYVAGMGGTTLAAFNSFSSEGWPSRGVDLGYRTGIDILESRVQRLQQQSPVNVEQVALAKIALADWLLLFERRTTALNLLEETYQNLVAGSESEAHVNMMLAPALPKLIPPFLHHRYTREWLGIPEDVPLQYKGFVDLEFKVNRFGTPSSINVLGMSPDTDKEISERLVSHIRHSQFQPRVQAGKVKTDDLYQLRYHYTY